MTICRAASYLLSTLLVMCGWAATSRGDEPDRKIIERETKVLKTLGKNALPAYASKKGVEGIIKLAGDGKADSKGATIWFVPLGWLADSSWPLKEGDVFINVGNNATPIKVGDTVLNQGEYVLYSKKKLTKVTLKDLGQK